MTDEREFDVLLWGATGYTGVHLVEHFVQNYPPQNEENVTWALVARSEEKLREVVAQVSEEYDAPWLSDVNFFITSNDDEEAVNKIVAMGKSVATVVGPFSKFGEPLLKACVENSTHYFDITGEVSWVKQMIENYHLSAVENRTFITPFCGVDSIPSDLCSLLAVKRLDKMVMEANDESANVQDKEVRIKGYYTDFSSSSRNKGAGGGTIETLMHALENPKEFKESQKPYVLTGDDEECTSDLKHVPQKFVSKNPELNRENQWSTMFVMAAANEKVVRRSRYLMPEVYGSDFSYHEAMAVGSFFKGLGVSAALVGAFGLLSFGPIRNKVRNWLPKPSKLPPVKGEKFKPGRTAYVALAEAAYGVDESNLYKCSVSMEADMDPGWTLTSVFLAESAITMVKNSEKIRAESGVDGGIVTPACLGETLVERLSSKGVNFVVVDR